jgi:hypothetical protein
MPERPGYLYITIFGTLYNKSTGFGNGTTSGTILAVGTITGNMGVNLPESMTDERRGLLTDNERAILLGDKDVSDNHYYTTVSRVRKKIERMEEKDIEALEAHGELADELREGVCDDE